MDPDAALKTRKSLHQLNNHLSIASMELELINLRLQKTPESESRADLVKSCSGALDAVRQAGRIANETLHQLQE